MGIHTELAYFFESEGKQIWLVGFKLEPLHFQKKLLKFLAGISFAIYVAAFELDDAYDEEEKRADGLSDQKRRDSDANLDQKQFLPRSASKVMLQDGEHGSPQEGNHHNQLVSLGSVGHLPTFDLQYGSPQNSSPQSKSASTQGDGFVGLDLSGGAAGDSPEGVSGVSGNNSGNGHNSSSSRVNSEYDHDHDRQKQTIVIGRGRSGSNAVIQEMEAEERTRKPSNDNIAQSYDAMPSVMNNLNHELPKVSVSLGLSGSGHSEITDLTSINYDYYPDNYVKSAPMAIGMEGNNNNNGHNNSTVEVEITHLTPTWDPVDPFSYPVADIPVNTAVPDNLAMEHFTDIKYIADGSNANVFLARLNEQKVVIKMIKEEVQSEPIAVHEFNVEHGILARVSHPNIIKLIGAGKSPRRFIVLEWLGGGTLNTILSHNQVKPGLTQKLFRRPSFTYSNLLLRANEICEALDFLNTKFHGGATIIHRDLKPDNIGFTSGGQLKLFDFGLCTCVRTRQETEEVYEMTGNTGSLRYMAPEVALKQPYNEKADVYSFGIMLWQMARDRVPFKGMTRDEFMEHVVHRGERPKLDKSWPQSFSKMMAACWNKDQKLRPSFKELSRLLQSLINEPSGSPRGATSSSSTSTSDVTKDMNVGSKKERQSTWF